jgi:hypothetical protein
MTGVDGPGDDGDRDDAPVRVTTLELFFDLVFAFTLTQLTALLVHHFTAAGALEVLLVFGVLWWMYGGYAWLTNTHAPDQTPERLLLLVGMAGFLVAGLAIPHGFGPGDTGSRVALGIGYLIVVTVHTTLFYRVNHNIVRVSPFNVTSALLVIAAAVDGRGGRPMAFAADRPSGRPVRHPARPLRRTPGGAGHRGARRVGRGHRHRGRAGGRDRFRGAVRGTGPGPVGRAVVELLRNR